MNMFPLATADFLNQQVILEIIKAGAAGLAILVAFLSYRLTSEVVRGEPNKIRANLAKFTWMASLILVVIMVGAELIRFIHPPPVLGIQANGWNRDNLGNEVLQVQMWEGKMSEPFVITSKPYNYQIQGSSPFMTIQLDNLVNKLAKTKEVATEAIAKVQNSQPTNQHDSGPGTTP